ncbi:MAG: hypothetical protein MH204_09980 [Fimbriimonadaceae bacterium]|nr:hypothetical protein [Fimbriimonadaceae bacterium]
MTTSFQTYYVHYKHRHNAQGDLHQPNTVELEEAMQAIVNHANENNLRIVSIITLPAVTGTVISEERSAHDHYGHASGQAIGMTFVEAPEGVSISVIYQSLD